MHNQMKETIKLLTGEGALNSPKIRCNTDSSIMQTHTILLA